MTTMNSPIFNQVRDTFTTTAPRYHQPNTPQEGTMGLIQTIEHDLAAAGHEVSGILHGVLTRHLTLASIAGHVATEAAAVEGNPVVQMLEKAALGPAGEAAVAAVISDLAAFLAPSAVPVQVPGPAEAAALADEQVPADPVEPVQGPPPAGPVFAGQA
jgi:hypothetical protein